MQRYIWGRLGQAVLVLWAAYTVTFLILYGLPGDAVSLLLGEDGQNDLTEDQLKEVRARYGLDQPLWLQYLTRLAGVLRGDFGTSYVSGRPVLDLLLEAIPYTAQIAFAGLLLGLTLGAALAIVGTYTRLRWLSRLLIGLPPLGVAIPNFWFGLVLLQVFSFTLGIFPPMGNEGWRSIVLPAITLSITTAAIIAQLLSKSLETTLALPYVDTAWAKGASRVRVHLRHALRNAALPTLTLTGLMVGGVLGGAVVTETVFSRNGVGRLTATAVSDRDIPVVLGVVLLAATAFVLVNLAVDLLYPLIDPRIVSGARSRGSAPASGSGPVDEQTAGPVQDGPVQDGPAKEDRTQGDPIQGDSDQGDSVPDGPHLEAALPAGVDETAIDTERSRT